MTTWKKYHPLTDQNAFICLVDSMGDDSSIVQAARVNYGKDEPQESLKLVKKDRNLIRYLLNHGHTIPFEMVEFKFMVQVPMDCWRQWIRHRTASVNECSARCTEALNFFQVTKPSEWRLQATNSEQDSSGFLESWKQIPEEHRDDLQLCADGGFPSQLEAPGHFLSEDELRLGVLSHQVYKTRINAGIAKEQARKDLPLSTYTRAYWKCNLHNIFNFLRLRMDSHAQLEIRQFANCMFEIVKQICPVACEAFEDYVLNAHRFSRMEMEIIRDVMDHFSSDLSKPLNLTGREWSQFKEKLCKPVDAS